MLDCIQAGGIRQQQYFFTGPALFAGAIPMAQKCFIPFLLPFPALLTFVKVS